MPGPTLASPAREGGRLPSRRSTRPAHSAIDGFASPQHCTTQQLTVLAGQPEQQEQRSRSVSPARQERQASERQIMSEHAAAAVECAAVKEGAQMLELKGNLALLQSEIGKQTAALPTVQMMERRDQQEKMQLRDELGLAELQREQLKAEIEAMGGQLQQRSSTIAQLRKQLAERPGDKCCWMVVGCAAGWWLDVLLDGGWLLNAVGAGVPQRSTQSTEQQQQHKPQLPGRYAASSPLLLTSWH